MECPEKANLLDAMDKLENITFYKNLLSRWVNRGFEDEGNLQTRKYLIWEIKYFSFFIHFPKPIVVEGNVSLTIWEKENHKHPRDINVLRALVRI